MLRWAKCAIAEAEFSAEILAIYGLITIQEHTSPTLSGRRLLPKIQQLMKVSEAAHLSTQIAPDLPLLSGAGAPLKHMCNIKNKSRSHQPATKVVTLLSACFSFATQRVVLQPRVE